jgi:hypothetical protein
MGRMTRKDREIIYRYNKGSDIKLSNAQRLLGVTLTLEEVLSNYEKIKNKMDFWRGNELPYKTFSRWKNGHSEPMYFKLADLNEYIKERISEEKEDATPRFTTSDNALQRNIAQTTRAVS